MPGKMRAIVNQFFTRRQISRSSSEKNCAILEKYIDLLFLRFYNCEPFKGGAYGQIANFCRAVLLNRALLGFSGYFWPLNTVCQILQSVF